jgi:hypothetical protein
MTQFKKTGVNLKTYYLHQFISIKMIDYILPKVFFFFLGQAVYFGAVLKKKECPLGQVGGQAGEHSLLQNALPFTEKKFSQGLYTR